jgi:hypothetical protein
MIAFILTYIESPVNTARLNWQAEDAIIPEMIDHIQGEGETPQ